MNSVPIPNPTKYLKKKKRKYGLQSARKVETDIVADYVNIIHLSQLSSFFHIT